MAGLPMLDSSAQRYALFATLAAVLVLLAGACGGSGSTSPTPTVSNPPPAVTVTGISVTGSAPQVGLSSQMSATATLSNATTQNVTTQATWQSSNQAVATVSGGGLVTGRQAGTVDITATYQNVNGNARLTVPQPVVLTYTVSGTVTDGTSGGILPGIRMSITTGTNAGKSTTTDSTGKYSITGIAAGSMTVSGSATSYQTVDKVVNVTGDTRVDFVLPRVAGPPAPPATCTLGTGAFIKFSTDSTSTKCWVSPISLKINGCTVGSMSNSGSATFPVAPGTYSAQACDKTGCASLSVNVAAGGTFDALVYCNTSSSSMNTLQKK